MSKPVDALTKARRVVIKIGSRALSSDPGIYDVLATGVAGAHAEQRSVAMVSSGAIALGMKKMGLATKPKEMALLQASAAAGQSVLMRMYEEAFARQNLSVAQVLLTHADLADRTRANNARDALAALLDAKLVPIINENDTVAVEEIRFGENDLLASMVTPLVSADLLILLSDVAGLLDEKGERVAIVRNVTREARPLIKASAPGPGTGGMASKVEAARRAMLAGASVAVADARQPGTIGKFSLVTTWERCSCRTRNAFRHESIGSRSRCVRAAPFCSMGELSKRWWSGDVACCRLACWVCEASSDREMRSRW